MRHLLTLLAAGLFIAASCNKEHLPEYYFKCKVDGQEYTPDNCANCRNADILGDSVVLLQGSRGVESILLFGFSKPFIAKSFILNEERTKHTADYDNTIGNPPDIFRTDSLRTGQLNITKLDKANKVIEGTFFFDAYNQVQNKTVKVSEGKFRLQYKTY